MSEVGTFTVILIVAFLINFLLVSFASLGVGITCPDLSTDYGTADYTYANQTVTLGADDIIDLALGRCDGLPFWLVLIIELPLIVGLFFYLRKFVGFT